MLGRPSDGRLRPGAETHDGNARGSARRPVLADHPSGCLAPYWGSLIHDVDVELEDGVERAFINILGTGLGIDDERRRRSFERSLEDKGVNVLVRRAYPYAEPFLG